MKLVIAEKPSVAKQYAEVLGSNRPGNGYFQGNGYLVTWCVGHLVTLKNPDEYKEMNWKDWNLEDLPIIPKFWQYQVISNSKKQFNIVKELMNRDDVELIINGTDAGREGEHIFRLTYMMANCKKPFKRLWLHSLTKKDITTGFDNLQNGHLFDRLEESAAMREKADWLYGINLTRLMSVKLEQTYTYGRVQTPTLKLIVDRANEIKSFKKFFTYKLTGLYRGAEFQTEEFKDKSEVQKKLFSLKGCSGVILKIEDEIKTEKPPKLYDLTSLQRDCNSAFGFSAKKTLNLLQELYEQKIVTYPRTDSRYITQTMESSVNDLFNHIVFQERQFSQYRNLVGNVKQVVNDKKVTDHHAILLTQDYFSRKTPIHEDAEKILFLLKKRIVQSMMDSAKYLQRNAVVSLGDLLWKSSAKKIMDRGYTLLDKCQEPKNMALFDMRENDSVTWESIKIVDIEKKPKPFYTEATLLSEMEHAGAEQMNKIEEIERVGLGTPATRADIIEKLIYQGYITRDKKSLKPTEKGIYFIGILDEKLKSVELSVEWEKRLALIKQGKDSKYSFMEDLEKQILNLVDLYRSKEIKVMKQSENTVVGKCPICGKKVYAKIGKKGKYFVCENNSFNDEGCSFYIGKSLGYFDNQIEMTETRVRNLLSGKEITAKIQGKSDTKYSAKFKLKLNGKWVNLQKV